MNGALLVGTNYWAQLYYGSANASEMELISVSQAPVPFRSSTTSVPGTWNASADRIRTLEGFPAGSAVTLQVRVWDATVGSSWEQAMSQGFGGTQYGASNPFQYFVQVEGCQPVTCYYMDNLRGFMLVPEPSVIALAVLGAGGLLLLRRRK